jgi:hypothetical protein
MWRTYDLSHALVDATGVGASPVPDERKVIISDQ